MFRQLAIAPVLFAVGATSCATTPKVDTTPGTVDVEVDRVMPMAESLDASAVEITLKLYNPTTKPVTLAGITYGIDTKEVAGKLEGKVDGGATLEPEEEIELKFRQSIRFPADTEAYRAVIERSTIPFELAGKVALESGDAVDFSRVGEVATPSLPKFVVHEAQAARYGKSGVDVTLFLRLINENVFNVMIEGVEYTVFIQDKEVKKEQAAVGIKLLAAAAEEYEAGTVLDGSTLTKEEIAEILRNRKVSYRVTGVLELTRLSIPFDHQGEIELATGE